MIYLLKKTKEFDFASVWYHQNSIPWWTTFKLWLVGSKGGSHDETNRVSLLGRGVADVSFGSLYSTTKITWKGLVLFSHIHILIMDNILIC